MLNLTTDYLLSELSYYKLTIEPRGVNNIQAGDRTQHPLFSFLSFVPFKLGVLITLINVGKAELQHKMGTSTLTHKAGV